MCHRDHSPPPGSFWNLPGLVQATSERGAHDRCLICISNQGADGRVSHFPWVHCSQDQVSCDAVCQLAVPMPPRGHPVQAPDFGQSRVTEQHISYQRPQRKNDHQFPQIYSHSFIHFLPFFPFLVLFLTCTQHPPQSTTLPSRLPGYPQA